MVGNGDVEEDEVEVCDYVDEGISGRKWLSSKRCIKLSYY